MKTWNWILLGASLLVPACGGDSKSPDEIVEATVNDTRIVKDAEAAANAVIRSTGDCDAVTSAFADAMAKLDEVEGQVQTAVGKNTVATLRKQVTTVGEACGAR
jgi:hypothetical protein